MQFNRFLPGKIALGGVLTALCVVCMFLTNLIPIATYALPALACLIVMIAVIEMGKRWALMVYAAASLLSLVLVTDVEAKLVFILFFGYYAILKSVFESLHRPRFCIALKLAVFNLAVIAAYYAAVGLFQVPMSDFELFHVQIPLLFLAFGNVVFLLLDVAMTRMATMYMARYHARVRRTFHFEH